LENIFGMMGKFIKEIIRKEKNMALVHYISQMAKFTKEIGVMENRMVMEKYDLMIFDNNLFGIMGKFKNSLINLAHKLIFKI